MTIRVELPAELVDKVASSDHYFQQGFASGMTVAAVALVTLMVVQLWTKK